MRMSLSVRRKKDSTVLDADRILVVDDGQIVGNGTHRELLDTCPLYREIAEIQLGKEAL